MAQNWLEFWQRKNNFDNGMIDNYNYFLAKVENHVSLTKELTVLDIGSGPGYLADAWHNRVKEIHGVDVSERYNAIAAEKHKNHANIFFNSLNPNDYLNFSVLNNKKFDLIIVMSVLQYYRNIHEVKQLLINIKQHIKPGTKLFLCDLIVHEGMIKDLLSILLQSFKKGNFFSTFIFLFKLRFSKYYYIKKKHGLLVIREEEWRNICSELNLNATFINQPITLQKDRKSLLITF